jgi:membrane protein YdbS with pleckstrin-like domain
MSEDVLYTGRKSFIAYVSSIFGRVILIVIVNAIFFGVSRWWVEAEAPRNVLYYLSLAWTVVNIYLVLMSIYHLFYIRTIQWIVSDEGVTVKQGILPWAKIDFLHPYDTIFEAYYGFGFFAKLFGYGTCHIRRAEGSTTEVSEDKMQKAGKIVGLINDRLKELKQQMQGQGTPVAARTDAEELAHLAQLKEDGSITYEEFETMKRKVIER